MLADALHRARGGVEIVPLTCGTEAGAVDWWNGFESVDFIVGVFDELELLLRNLSLTLPNSDLLILGEILLTAELK